MKDVSSRQQSLALIAASKSGDLDKVRRLLTPNVDLNATEQFGGWTALMWATQRGHSKIVQLLLEKGADPKRSSLGTTALLIASRGNNPEVLNHLKRFSDQTRRRNRYGGLWARLLGKDRKRAREEYFGTMRSVVRRKVEDPFKTGSYCALGDVFLESAMDGTAVHTVMKSYNIDEVSSVFDPTSNVTIETVMMHGRGAALQDTFGSVISDPNHIPKLVPRSELDLIAQYLSSKNQPIEYWAGHVAERFLRTKLESSGYEVLFPSHSNQPGYDLLVDKKFFEDHDLPFNEDLATGLGKLQVKNVRTPTAIREHIDRYVNGNETPIPLIAPDDMCQHFSDQPIVSFSELGLTRDYIHDTVQTQVTDIAAGHFADVAQGMNTDVFQQAVEGYGGLVPDLGIPYMGVFIASALTTYKSYSLFTKGRIDLPEAALNVLKAGGAALVLGTATKLACAGSGSLALAVISNDSSVSEAIGEGISAAGNIAAGDWDLGDVQESVEAVAVVLVVAGTAWAVKKGFHWSTSQAKKAYDWFKKTINPSVYKKFEELRAQFGDSLVSFHTILGPNEGTLKDAFGAKLFKFQEQRLAEIERGIVMETEGVDNKATLPSMSYFFLEYAHERQREILDQMRENLPHHPLSRVTDFYNRLEVGGLNQANIKYTVEFAHFLNEAKGSVLIPERIQSAALRTLRCVKELSAFIQDMHQKNLPVPEIS